LNIAFPIFAGIAGAAGGWFVSWIVDRATAMQGRTATVLAASAAGLILFALAFKFATGIPFLIYGVLVLVLIGITLFDLRTHSIPHIVTLPGIAAGLLIGTSVLPLGFVGSLAGAAVGGGILLAAALVESLRKKEIGGGDWKYAAMIGSFVGPQKIVIALVLTGVFGFVGALALAVSGSSSRPQALGPQPQALAPWISAGAVASIFIG
jgi:leader peptidase (prepilin peptidase)/N-methyltransferase